jgi:hypothetical protein
MPTTADYKDLAISFLKILKRTEERISNKAISH